MNDRRHKRKRLPNLTNVERELLIDLAIKYKDILENKKTDAGSCKEKETAWKTVAVQFNAGSTLPRDWANLKHAYENMKHAVKKKLTASKKLSRQKTVGDPAETEINANDEKVLSLLVNTVVPLNSDFDSDAIYSKENPLAGSAADDIQSGTQDSSSTVYGLDLKVEDADSGEASTLPQIPSSIQGPVGPVFEGQEVTKRNNRMRPKTPPSWKVFQKSVELSADYVSLKKTYYDELIKGLKADQLRKEADERRKEAEESRRIAEEDRKKETHEATMALLKAQASYYKSLTSKMSEES